MKTSDKIRVGVLFGGRSVEHQVSLVSATSVLQALNKSRYEVIQIGISQQGQWICTPTALHILQENSEIPEDAKCALFPDPTVGGLVNVKTFQRIPVDVIFPVVHGTYAEDGTLQGLFELADIPYVGAGVLGSAVGMDKIIQKQLLQNAKIPVAKFIWFYSMEFNKASSSIIRMIENQLHYPVFVKPARSGSSVGISKSHNRKELKEHIEYASQYDMKVLVEKAVLNAREIECSVIGNEYPTASVPGEIVPSNEFYDYNAKYVDGKSESYIPAKLPKQLTYTLQKMAVEVFKVLDCSGMARVDFLMNAKTNKVVVNEINTIPGFTSISMYPKLWEASGLSYSSLLDKLIDLAFERHSSKKKLQVTYKPVTDWFKEK